MEDIRNSTERQDRMYDAMKEDINRHETLCFELAMKFEEQNNYLVDLQDHI